LIPTTAASATVGCVRKAFSMVSGKLMPRSDPYSFCVGNCVGYRCERGNQFRTLSGLFVFFLTPSLGLPYGQSPCLFHPIVGIFFCGRFRNSNRSVRSVKSEGHPRLDRCSFFVGSLGV
jgi:hypothetical protein